MADNKQPQLNGAYYGPAIPPAEQPRAHPRYSRRRSCCCCLFGFFWKLLLALIVIVGIAILVFWLVVRPQGFKYHVSDAKLTQFEYDNNTLRYDLVLNFTARNPNKKLNIYYDRVEGRASYEDNWFSSTDVITHLNSFRQYTKRSDPMSAHFAGQHVMVLDQQDLDKFNSDKARGAFDIDLKLKFRIRFRLGDFITGDYKPTVKCDLNIPLATSNNATGFQSTQCDVDFF
ncbi:NDR1/HIN1-like protein 10 [Senna tora]|uniref:NDR1/HIN1-like protein 10 n=1 Tax=Senna tora TaxID=362788 RepID=A0A834SIR2_9FABA|nr:NDR1/HIN1-like protein 10 [Senna tora]